jgi:hypothetical protein
LAVVIIHARAVAGSPCAHYLIRKKRLVIQRDRELGLYLVRDEKTILKQLKELLRGERFSLTIEPRSS